MVDWIYEKLRPIELAVFYCLKDGNVCLFVTLEFYVAN
jgi:hypothetical protein